MRLFLLLTIFLSILDFYFVRSQISIPSEVSNLQLWLRADSGLTHASGIVSQWSDQSGFNNHYLQANVSRQPQFIQQNNILNNLPSVRFDGLDDFMSGSIIIPNFNNSSFTIFIIANGESQNSSISSLFSIATASTGLYICRRPSTNVFGVFNNNSNKMSTSGTFPGAGYNFKVFTISKDLNNSLNLYSNGVNVFISTLPGMTSAFSSNVNYQLGAGNSSNFFKGDIAEIIIYNRVLTSSEQQQVENYLMDKYAPPINLGADINNTYGFCDIALQPTGYFTNYLWSTGATTSTLNVNAPGTYWVQGTDVFGRMSYDTIVINWPHLNEVALTNQLVCFNQPVTITANLPQGNYSFVQWSDSNTNPVRELNQNETISYTVSDSLGCTRTSNLATITLDNSLENISLGIDTNLCSGNTILLVQDTNAITAWLWNTGDTTETLAIDTSGIYQLFFL